MEIQFKGHDVYLLSCILGKVGMAEFLSDTEELEKLSTRDKEKYTEKDKKVIKERGRKLIAMLGQNMHLVEKEINALLEHVTGKTKLSDMPYEEYDAVFSNVFESEDFPGFFQSAFRLALKMAISKVEKEKDADTLTL